MKTRQDQFLLAWIGIDVAHRKNTRNVRLKFFGVDDDRSFVELQPPVGNWAEPRMQAEENERMVRLELDELALSRLHAHAAELPSLDKNRMRDPFHVAHAAIGDELLHLRHGRWCRAKLGSTMDQSETARLACQFQRPVERRVATAEDQQSLPGEIRRALHPVMDMAALECLRSFATEPARLKRTEPRRDDHRLGMETRIERRAHQERAVFEPLELRGFLAEMKLCVERLDLLQEPIDELLRGAHGNRRNVVDRLVRIQLAALSSWMLERIDDMCVDAEQPQLEDLEHAARTGSDDDGIRLDRAFDQRRFDRIGQPPLLARCARRDLRNYRVPDISLHHDHKRNVAALCTVPLFVSGKSLWKNSAVTSFPAHAYAFERQRPRLSR